MSDDYDDDARPARRAKSGDSTVKTLLIIFGSFAALAVLACCGIGFGSYFWLKKNFGQALVTTPADIQKITTEITDITIPPEFKPQTGSSIFGVKNVTYQWCPAGNCPQRGDGLGMLMLMSIGIQGANGPNNNTISKVSEEQFSDQTLQQQWKDYTKIEHEFVIRGKKCKFFIVQGQQTGFGSEDDDDEMQTDSHGEETAANDAGNTATGAGPKAVQISGAFPGKEAECTLMIHLTAEEYDEEKILGMLRSIK
jgi:hypothetical protein